MSCPLCAGSTEPHHRDAKRTYHLCGTCGLVHVPARFHLDLSAERAVYDQHDNRPDDPRYRAFLARALDPLREVLASGSRGLDFGCGPGPTVSIMATESGLSCCDYDPLYANMPERLSPGAYDFVIATEVVEHLRRPAATLRQMFGLVRPGGWISLMTKRTTTAAAFPRWHYIHDPTHIAFFAESTLRWLAHRHGCEVRFPAADVALFQRA